jgi:hypothetical protein
MPIQAAEDYFNDNTDPWDNFNGFLSGYSDDIVLRPSQSIKANLPPAHTKATLQDIPTGYLSSDFGIWGTTACWVGGILHFPMLHFMTCLGNQPRTQGVVISQVVAHMHGVLIGNKPDLVETAVSNPPLTIKTLGTFPVTDTTLNQGASSAGSSTTRYYLSLDTIKGSTDKLLTGARAVPTLAVGVSSSGTVTVTVPATTAAGTYFLLACADDKKVVVESNEKNNCLASSGTVVVGGSGKTIGLGQAVSGTLSVSASAGHCNGGAPADQWNFTLPSTTTVTIDARSTAFDTFVCLLDASNNFLAQDADSGTGTNARLIYKNLPLGSYTIEVSSSSAGHVGGAYTLNLQPGFWPPAPVVALGSTTAGNLSTTAANGACNSSAPVDRYAFTLAATTTVTIDVSSTAFDTFVCLLDANNNYLAQDRDSGTGTNARLIYNNLSVGTYYIEVSSSSAGNAGGAYTLNLQPGFWPPAPVVALGSTTAGNLSTTAANGVCNSSAPVDRYAFTLAATTTVTIDVSSTAFDTFVCLLDANNNFLGQDDNSGGGTNSRLQVTLPASTTYYIEVSSKSIVSGAYNVGLH